jgi:hypothetical protein
VLLETAGQDPKPISKGLKIENQKMVIGIEKHPIRVLVD